jgi:hypothetical protein
MPHDTAHATIDGITVVLPGTRVLLLVKSHLIRVRGHRPEIMFSMLVVVLGGYGVAV